MIKFEVTRDPELLQQYYELRETSFRQELGVPDFDGSEEEPDRCGQILIAHRLRRCLGGVRISSEVKLRAPILAEGASCMWERFVIAPPVRSLQFTREFISHLIEKSGLLGYRHALVLSSKRNARFYRACHTALGVDFEICRPAPECATGPFAGLEHYLSVSFLEERQESRLAA